MTRGIVAAIVLLLTVHNAHGQPSNASAFLDKYTLTSWTEKDGLPSSRIRSIAQDEEGYLWLGTDAGLVRFDGIQFVLWEGSASAILRRAPIAIVCVARDQSVWVVFVDGDVTHFDSHGSVTYNHQGLWTTAVSALVEDSNGVMWLGSDSGLYRFNGRIWELWSTGAHGLSPGSVSAAASTPNGDLLVGLSDALYSQSAHATSFSLVQRLDRPLRDVAEDAGGTIWLTDAVNGVRALRSSNQPRRGSERAVGTRLLIDHRGSLWLGTGGQGLWCVEMPYDGQRTIMKSSIFTGLSGNGVRALIEDRDGNIWAGNSGGLNRITEKKAWSITEPGTVRSVQSAVDGRIWVSMDGEVVSLSPNGQRTGSARLSVPPSELPAIAVDHDSVVWTASNMLLTRLDHAGIARWNLTSPKTLRQIETITSDSHGGLWIYDRRQGLLQFTRGQLEPFRAAGAFARAQVITSYTDHSGRAWFAFDDGTVASITADGLRTFGVHDGLTGGMYQAIYEDDSEVLWLAGTAGLSRWLGGERFHTFNTTNGIPAEPLTALVEDDAHNLWIAGASGIYRIMHSEIDRAAESASYRIQYAVLDTSDGVAGHPMATGFGNRLATRAADGRLWFVTGRGLTVIDRHQALRAHVTNSYPRVEQVVVNGQPIARVDADVHLPARTQRVDIQYAIIELTSPRKTRFRYRLDGVDPTWTDPVVSRQASYANLAPGQYTFHLEATDENGSWRESKKAFAFDIAPAFYKTPWFVASCGCLFLILTGGVWQLRLRQVQRQFAVRLEERTRLSRELHDTLLQYMVGIALQCEIIAGDADELAPATRNHLLRLRRQVERYGRELRKEIWTLRSPDTPLADLANVLQQAGEQAIEGTDIEFEFAVAGFPRPCHADVEDQLKRIGQEAVTNAVRHSGAAHIKMELRYEDSTITLRVSDDGHGFDVPDAKSMNGHYGLIGMRERAASVSAVLSVNSSVRGTDVETTVPTTGAIEVMA